LRQGSSNKVPSPGACPTADGGGDGRELSFMKKAVDLFWKMLSNVTLFCFIAMLFVMILQVFFRDVLRISVSWTDETTRYFFIWAIFLGSALAQRTREHIRITVLVDRFRPRLRRFFNTVIDIFSILISMVLLIGCIKMMITTYGVLTSTIPISFTYIYLALALGITMMVILLIRDVIKVFAR
jgi:TRAP-type transport system small permease protein